MRWGGGTLRDYVVCEYIYRRVHCMGRWIRYGDTGVDDVRDSGQHKHSRDITVIQLCIALSPTGQECEECEK